MPGAEMPIVWSRDLMTENQALRAWETVAWETASLQSEFAGFLLPPLDMAAVSGALKRAADSLRLVLIEAQTAHWRMETPVIEIPGFGRIKKPQAAQTRYLERETLALIQLCECLESAYGATCLTTWAAQILPTLKRGQVIETTSLADAMSRLLAMQSGVLASTSFHADLVAVTARPGVELTTEGTLPMTLLALLAMTAFELLSRLTRRLLPAASESDKERVRQREIEFAELCREDDAERRPDTTAEFTARTLWESGDLWLGSAQRLSNHGSVVGGGGLYAQRVTATVGATRRDHMASMLSGDRRVSDLKRNARTREFYRPPGTVPSVEHALTLEEFARVYDAVAFANRCGVVLNARVTIAWFMVDGCSADECRVWFDSFKKNVTEWLRGRQPSSECPWPAYVYVHETKGRDKWHTHMRFAAPAAFAADFRTEVRQALRRIIAARAGSSPVAGQACKLWGEFVRVRVSKVGDLNTSTGRLQTMDQWIGVRYMLKGADPTKVIASLGKVADGPGGSNRPVALSDLVDWQYENPGRPWTKRRVGMSEALGPAARRAFHDVHGRFESLLTAQMRQRTVDVRDLFSDRYLLAAAGRL